MAQGNKKQKLQYYDVDKKLKSLADLCDWHCLDHVAIEYHDLIKIQTIKYAELNEARQKVVEILECINNFEFIGIYVDVPEYCVPALMLGITTRGLGFANLPAESTMYTKFLSDLNIKYIFVRYPIDSVGIICNFVLHGECLYLLKFKQEQEQHIQNVASGYAYAIGTSGSTGEAKIVKVLHSCIVPNIIDLKSILCIKKSDKIAQLTSFTFDPSIIEIFLSFHSASTIFMVSKEIKNDVDRLLDLMFWNNVTVLQSTPSLFLHRWSSKRLGATILGKDSQLRVILLGGEPFPKSTLLTAIKHPGNTTQFFNIYGITEVSCWASINKVVLTDIETESSTSCLGVALSETIFQVRNEDGSRVSEGVGSLYIGSSSRFCIIDDEVLENLSTPVFRDSGDIVHIDNQGCIFYKGRRNEIIKRYGNRLNLLKLNQTICELDFVHNCYSWWDVEMHKLHLCICTVKKAPILPKLKNAVILHLEKLPMIYKPDKIHFIENVELTVNGKICNQFLQKICREDRMALSSTDTIKECFENTWNNHLNSTSAGFLKLGGTSIMALQISTEICELLNTQFPNLIGMLLKDATFEECLTYLRNILLFNMQDEMNVPTIHKSMHTYVAMQHSLSNNMYKGSEENMCLWQKCRGKTYTHLLLHDWTSKSDEKAVSHIRIKSSHDLLKCVDASPTVFQYKAKTFATVGSHSGVICTVELNTEGNGDLHKVKLPNRIESSIVVLNNFKGIVGCYDSHVYCVHLKTGEIIWKYHTGDIVKCTAVLCESKKNIFIGSYDRNIYCLSAKDGSKNWSVKASEGSISASGCLHVQTKSILFGTLDGSCLAIDQSIGDIIWRHKLADPIFVAPVTLHNGFVLFCSVGGTLICFDIQADTKIWTYKINGNIFAYPVTQYDPIANCETIIIACLAKTIHHLVLNPATEQAEPIVKYVKKLSSPIFATPWYENALKYNRVVLHCRYHLREKNLLVIQRMHNP
ncbi:hypothetical protein KPH14_002404 [Odynerus spinipes]|uniref:Uncharacterized protein n=1 Tax=Odynerus spinipes TaxID=1348599 RepID=A0AAD9RLJ6_9HYME|nr:hypothetical protein KPH14_002404 [Odynerus spinipes]